MYDAIFPVIQQACGVAAAEVVRGQFDLMRYARLGLLQRYLTPEHNPMRRAYVLMEIVYSPSFAPTLPPHSVIQERDLRNLLRRVCPNMMNATVRGWGYRQTFNPAAQSGNTLPMLVHSFGLTKQVAAADAGWAPFYAGPGQAPNTVMARPVLRSLHGNGPQNIAGLLLSCSLISETKCATAAPAGFVLNAPCWNIFALAPKDMQFANDAGMGAQAQAVGALAGANHLALPAAHDAYPTLASLIAATAGGERYNEIVVLGRSAYYLTQVRATGIFVKVAMVGGVRHLVDYILPQGIPELDILSLYHDDVVINAMRACSLAHRLPIVPVVDANLRNRATDRPFAAAFAGCTINATWDCALE